MIFYRPTDGDVQSGPIAWAPRACFLMSAMGGPLTTELVKARQRTRSLLRARSFRVRDAASATTGKDYLLKIWQLAVSSAVGIAMVHEGIRPETMANVFYELGLMQAYGRETIVIRVGAPMLPSDLVRTEYIQFDRSFARRFGDFLGSLPARAEYYLTLANQLERNPLLAIDYLRRSFLLSGDVSLRRRAKRIATNAGLLTRARDSVERNLLQF